ncbi:MAG: UDP-2,3-diacylglucosamine diphosphatase [Pseudomonadales bacterium]
MSNHSLFISDLHLCAQRPDISEAFVRFCTQRAINAEALYILGDLSDAWLGDDDDSDIAELLKSEIKKLTDAGVKVFIMVGNRDFLMGQQFATDCQCTLLADPSVIDLYGQSVLLMHGDSLCTEDAEYMAFRAQIRNPDMQQVLLSKSLDERRGIAKMLREKSRSANATKTEDIMDVTPSEVVKALNDHNVDIMIHGHTHRPAIHNLIVDSVDAKRYVLGDWDKKGWCITASKDTSLELSLESFDI